MTPPTEMLTEIKIRRATDLEEVLSDLAQPLLEIAEGKRPINEWNDRLMDLLKEATKWMDKAEKAGVEKGYRKGYGDCLNAKLDFKKSKIMVLKK